MNTGHEYLTCRQCQDARRDLGWSPRRAITGAPREWTPLVYPLPSGGVGSHKPVSPWSAETTALINNQDDVPTEPRRAVR